MSKPPEEPKDIDQTEHAKLSRLVVEKMHAPKDIHDKNIHSNVSKQILSNVLLLGTGVDGMKELTRGDLEVIDDKKKTVTVFRKKKILTVDPTTKVVTEKEELVPYRTLSRGAYTENQFFGEFWSKMDGNLLELLMSVPVGNGQGGWRGEQAEREVSALTNSDRELLASINNRKPGLLSRMRNALSSK